MLFLRPAIRTLLASLVGLMFFGIICPQAAALELRLKHGDDPRWAARDWDDADWQKIAADEFPARDGIYWVRFQFVRSERQAGLSPGEYSFLWPTTDPEAPINCLFSASVYSFELYWDGRLLARSGVVGGSRAEEIAGPLDHLILLPEDLRGPGEHIVALRMSSYHYNFPATRFSPGFRLDNYERRMNFQARQPLFPLVGAGGSLLMAAVSGVFYWFLERRRALLICSGLSAVLALFYALIALRWLYNAPYDWHCPRLVAITALMTVIGGLLPWLLLEQFAMPRRHWCLAVLAPLLVCAWLASPIYEIKALWTCRAMLTVSLGITGWAVWRRRSGAWFVLAGVLFGLLMVRTECRVFLDPSFFLILGGLVLFVFIALGARLRADREHAKETVLTAARLEIELLKKNLQPHFLLNTLTAISEVIEQDPPGAVRFIDDLAAEFRSLARMSGEKLVPLAQELDLSHAHLRVIARRTGRSFVLESEGENGAALVPPALFLTLIENGLVHQRPPDGAVFRLRVAQTGSGVRYTFFSPGVPREPAVHRPAGGTGLRYMKARLEESFPGRWAFSHQQAAEGWETVIDLSAGKIAGGTA